MKARVSVTVAVIAVALGVLSMGGGLAIAQDISQEQIWNSTIQKTPSEPAPKAKEKTAEKVTAKPNQATPSASLPRATAITFQDSGQDAGAATTFTMSLSAGVRAEIYTLADPYRVIIDLPNIAFAFDDHKPKRLSSQVLDYRYGLFSEGKARVVIDTKGPVRIVDAAMQASKTAGDGAVELTFRIEPVTNEAFVATAPETKDDSKTKAENASKAEEVVKETIAAADERSARSERNRRPVIMIDPGHGGVDPGATGGDGILEKDIVLQVASVLAKQLKAAGRYDVHLTRDSDVFVSLDERVKKSRSVAADLFISLHADAIADEAYLDRVRGASIYTLSDRASDEQSRLMAEKENASDLIAGIETGSTSDVDHVRDILIDLMARETANFSARFSNLLTSKLGAAITLSRSPQRAAAFKVLKQPHAPSVLVELGYISNAKDRKQLTSKSWQKTAARAIAKAVGTFFKASTVARQPDSK